MGKICAGLKTGDISQRVGNTAGGLYGLRIGPEIIGKGGNCGLDHQRFHRDAGGFTYDLTMFDNVKRRVSNPSWS